LTGDVRIALQLIEQVDRRDFVEIDLSACNAATAVCASGMF